MGPDQGVGRLVGGVVLALLLALPAASEERTDEAAAREPAVRLDEFGNPEGPQSLREGLTEREDENRVEDPTRLTLFGRPLTISGQFEVSLDFARRTQLGTAERRTGSTILETEIEAELFYTISDDIYAFVQGVVGWERQVTAPRGVHAVEDAFAERGEMWLAFREIGGLPVHLEIGRLDFDDDRTWWWDEDLDAIRLEVEGEDIDFALAAAREIAPRSTLDDRIDPESKRVLRVFGEFSWEWADEHAFEVYALHHVDRSTTERVGALVGIDRVDAADATLSWIGPRFMGAWETGFGIVGYWLDGAIVHGRETVLEFEDFDRTRERVADRRQRNVRGWAFDVGASWLWPSGIEPRVTLSYAMGSGDATPNQGSDRGFRQSGLQANESGYGGVERFNHYGWLLGPELSNLSVATIGFGVSIFESSSLDLVLHDIRQVEASSTLLDSRIEFELDGRDEHVGSEIDLVLAIEEWDALELEFRAAAFRGGSAFAPGSEDWTYGAFARAAFAF